MKYAILIISLFNLNAFGSCLISIENGGKNYFVTIWKHNENEDDVVTHRSFSEKEVAPISHMLKQKNKIRVVFNDGVFTSMDYYEGPTKRWLNLTKPEKDMIFYIQEKFDVTEK